MQLSAKTEALADLIIIVDDSEDEWSKQNRSCSSFPGEHNVVGTCEKDSVPEEISDCHATQNIVHGRNMKGPLSAGNGMEDIEERNIDLGLPFLA